MFPPCIFCNNESGSEEHLWAAWMHRLMKFGPLKVQEGNDPETIEADPEKTINTVCHPCNNTWMSQLEEKNIPSLRPMMQNQPTTIDPGRQRLLTEWAVKTAMVLDSIKPGIGNEKFYTDAERLNMRLTRKIPERTRIWLGAMTEPHLGSFGTDLAIFGNNGTVRIGTGIATTIVVGHFAIQVVTEHIFPQFAAENVTEVQPRAGDWENMLIELYPKKQKKVEWPPKKPFTNGGPQGLAYLMHRWRMGQKVEKVVPVPP
jgi:hypothetical protein